VFTKAATGLYVPNKYYILTCGTNMMPCVSRGLAMGLPPVQGVLTKCLNGLIDSEVISELQQARGPRTTYITNYTFCSRV